MTISEEARSGQKRVDVKLFTRFVGKSFCV